MVFSPVKTSISESEEIKFAVSYIRVSTQQQTLENKSGIDRQGDEYIDWLATHPEYKNLDGVQFRDLGISGRGKNRKSGALALFISKAKKGEIPAGTCLVCSDMSRLTRDESYKGIKLIQEIWDLGLTIAFTEGRWRGDFLKEKDRGVFGQLESALDRASFEWEKLSLKILLK
tara:strand:- start:39 stop:557 length:519 start_codon:yes stop_codon:yes gene_type:complete